MPATSHNTVDRVFFNLTNSCIFLRVQHKSVMLTFECLKCTLTPYLFTGFNKRLGQAIDMIDLYITIFCFNSLIEQGEILQMMFLEYLNINITSELKSINYYPFPV